MIRFIIAYFTCDECAEDFEEQLRLTETYGPKVKSNALDVAVRQLAQGEECKHFCARCFWHKENAEDEFE